MNDIVEDYEDEIEETSEVSELDTLKARAKLKGIKFHHRVGIDTLRELVYPEAGAEPSDKEKSAQQSRLVTSAAAYRKKIFAAAKRGAGTLVRCRVSCMNPNKQGWEGEYFSVGSAKMGTHKKYIPFNGVEYHLPYVLYQELKAKKCTINRSEREIKKNGGPAYKLINEYAIERLDPLTKEELKDLAQQQAMAAGE